MAVFQPLEIHDENNNPTGLYHYTRTDAGGTFAIGHCSPWRKCEACGGQAGLFAGVTCEKCGNKGIVKKENPCPGHATPEEATAHYREWLLDNAKYDGRDDECQQKCGVCEAWTQGYAVMGGGYLVVHLCDEHRNREGLDKATGKYGERLQPAAARGPLNR